MSQIAEKSPKFSSFSWQHFPVIIIQNFPKVLGRDNLIEHKMIAQPYGQLVGVPQPIPSAFFSAVSNLLLSILVVLGLFLEIQTAPETLVQNEHL